MPAAPALRYTVLALCLASPFAFSQTGGQSGGSNTGGGTVKPAPSLPPRQTGPQRPPEERRMIFLAGRVMLDDGTPPTERVAIERVCNGRARREGYTDSHGQFSFQLGSEAQVFQDASVDSGSGFDPSRSGFGGSSPGGSAFPGGASSGFSTRDLMGCELRASLAGFRSDSISLAGRQLFDNPEVGTIVLHRMGKVEGTRISITTLSAPKDAKKAFARGNKLLKAHKDAQAGEEFAKAVALYPRFAEALAKLGEIQMSQGRDQDAEKLFQQSIEADSRYMPPYFDLVMLASRKQDWKRVAELSDRALSLNAYEYPAAYFFSAVANLNLQKLDLAEKNARMARRLDSQYQIPKIDLVLAHILLKKADYPGAAAELRTFLKYSPSGPEAENARQLLGDTESKLAAGPGAEPRP